jgi:hypothetical protein
MLDITLNRSHGRFEHIIKFQIQTPPTTWQATTLAGDGSYQQPLHNILTNHQTMMNHDSKLFTTFQLTLGNSALKDPRVCQTEDSSLATCSVKPCSSPSVSFIICSARRQGSSSPSLIQLISFPVYPLPTVAQIIFLSHYSSHFMSDCMMLLWP